MSKLRENLEQFHRYSCSISADKLMETLVSAIEALQTANAKPAEPAKLAKPTDGDWLYGKSRLFVELQGKDLTLAHVMGQSDEERDCNGRHFTASKRMAELLRGMRGRDGMTMSDIEQIDALLDYLDYGVES